ncbi:acylase, partial [Shewanella sp. 11B5]
DTLIPQHKYSPVMDVVSGNATASGLTAEGYQVRYGSSWMMTVSFTDDGPKAKGILTYSESSNVLSPSFSDQSELYSSTKQLRPLLFTEAEIQASVESSIELTLQK